MINSVFVPDGNGGVVIAPDPKTPLPANPPIIFVPPVEGTVSAGTPGHAEGGLIATETGNSGYGTGVQPDTQVIVGGGYLPAETPSVDDTIVTQDNTITTSLLEGMAINANFEHHLISDSHKPNGILYGTHNLDEARRILGSDVMALHPTTTPGIYILEYQRVNGLGIVKPESKTVFDPKVYTNQQMIDYALDAASQVWIQHGNNPPAGSYQMNSNGINFQIYLREVTPGGAVIVDNVFPIDTLK